MGGGVAETIERDGVIAIVRMDDLSDAVGVAEALARGGVSVVEFTFTNPRAGQAIAGVQAALGDRMIVGAGSVLDAETARTAILAGARFVVTPVVALPVIACCNRYGVPTTIGAFTPTEILAAWEAGATFVKVFPASAGGPRYLKDVRGPLPQVKLIPTGGVGIENAAEFIRAGASAIAVGGNLVDPALVTQRRWDELEARARSLIESIRSARQA